MKTYSEAPRKLPVSEEVDVLVVGGGPAGFSAAVCAAREGARTMLVEQSGQVGGVATTGLMSHWTGDTIGGFYQEILERSNSVDLKGLTKYSFEQHMVINPETLKTTMLEMLQEAGVILKLYTFACEVIKEGDNLKGIIVESKSGREAVFAKVVIDASGDGDIAAKAGAEYYKGREYDGKMQPMTLMFKVAGVDTARVKYVYGFENSYDIPAGDLQTVAREHIPFPAGHVLLYPTNIPGIVTCNMTNCIEVDGTKAQDLTKAEISCRSQIKPIVEFLRGYVPGFENCYIISSASIIGVRETRHFKGEKTLTEQDIIEGRVFEDWAVAKLHFNFDVHNMSGAGLDETGVQDNFRQVNWYTIPYGCLVPKKIDNLLLAGRNISGTHLAHSSYRVMPICANMGQSAGIAAALCAKHDSLPRDLDIKELQGELRKYGVEP